MRVGVDCSFMLYSVYYPNVFFFFSSRRRHTRFDCDWSSDVCSSDLFGGGVLAQVPVRTVHAGGPGTVKFTNRFAVFVRYGDLDLAFFFLGGGFHPGYSSWPLFRRTRFRFCIWFWGFLRECCLPVVGW